MFISEHERENSARWVSASEAVAKARQHYSSDQDAREFLIRRAGLGRVLTRCKSMRNEKRAARSEVIERDDCLVSPEFWSFYGPSRRRTLRDWQVGDFELTMEGRLGDRRIVMIAGVQFSETDIIAELPLPPVEWMRASEAWDLVNSENPGGWTDVAICSRAYENLVRARAAKFIWEEGSRPKRRNEKLNCDVPKEFWWAEGHQALEANWTTGDFSTWIDSTWQWKAFGVEFAKVDIQAMIPGEVAVDATEADSSSRIGNASTLPSEDAIEQKMKELMELGMKRDDAAKFIRQVSGFEGVGNEHARRVINGKVQRGRPKSA